MTVCALRHWIGLQKEVFKLIMINSTNRTNFPLWSFLIIYARLPRAVKLIEDFSFSYAMNSLDMIFMILQILRGDPNFFPTCVCFCDIRFWKWSHRKWYRITIFRWRWNFSKHTKIKLYTLNLTEGERQRERETPKQHTNKCIQDSFLLVDLFWYIFLKFALILMINVSHW